MKQMTSFSPFSLLERFVRGKMRFLGLGVGLARDQLGLLVDEAEAMQQRANAAGSVDDTTHSDRYARRLREK
jgi:hypothetical protein